MTRLACTVVALAAFTATAWAQDFEAAGRHFSAAQEAFGAKHFKTAAGEFEAAYAITKDPVLLYNVGESYEKSGDGHKAVASYKAYLKEQPTAQDRAEVQKRIKSIEAKGYKLASQSAPGDNPPSTATTTAPTPPPPTVPATPPPSTPTPPATTTAPLPPREQPTTPPPTTMPSTAPATTQTAPPAPMTPPPTTSEPAPTTAPPPATPPPPAATTEPAAAAPQPGLLDEGPTSKLRVAAWIGVAATLAVLTAGAIFGLSAESRADEINRRLSFVDMNNQPHKFDQSAQSDLQSLKDDGNLYNGLAIGFYSVAAVSAVATVTMFVVDAKRGKPAKERAWHLAPVAGKNVGGFALGGTF
ncbi:MAG TPA: hypothetical protein VF997_02225 [Polyangia bacterium]